MLFKKFNTNVNERLPFLSWIIIPILGVWFATNYVVGVIQRPGWTDTTAQKMSVEADIPEKKVEAYRWTGGGLVTFWFDDAWIDQYTVAFPILQEKGYKAAIAVPSQPIGWEDYMTWAQIKRLNYHGWEISAHSRTHQCDRAILSNVDVLNNELVGSQSDLLEQGYIADMYVPPCGVVNQQMVEVAKNHFLAFRTSEFGLNPIPVQDPYNLLVREVRETTTLAEVDEWLAEAKESQSWIILLFHKFDDEFEEFAIKPALFKQIVSSVEKSQMPVVLPSQVLHLISQR